MDSLVDVIIIGGFCLFVTYKIIVSPLLNVWNKKEEEKALEWRDNLTIVMDSIKDKIYYTAPQDFQNEFNQFFNLLSHDYSYYSRNISFQAEYYENHIPTALHSTLVENLQSKTGINIALNCLIALQVYYQYENNTQCDTQIDMAIEKINRLNKEVNKMLFCLKFNSYGDCELLLDETVNFEEELEYLQEVNVEILGKLHSENYSDSYQGIASINANFIDRACGAMWHYARKRPFDVVKFNDARQLFMVYTRFITKIDNDADGDDIEFGPVESVLAAVFAQNQIGGEGAIDKKYLNNWVDWNISRSYSGGPEGQCAVENCFLLCSGLAWMELYNLEKETLRKLFTQEIQLPNELQKRLTDLESGGYAKIKIYNSAPSADFLYDSSSQNWNDKDLDMFFRQLSLKQDKLGYSLVIEDWKKTIPLVPGTQVSQERLSNELAKLVDDFDGEVTSKVVNAKAVNLLNEVYPNATVFTFTSERSRCVSILFSCEKFGRNLNITIMTLFTPDSSLTSDKLYPYAAAIKGNMYISSFKESILQVVDEVIHIKEKMYDDDSASTSQQRKVFDGE